MLKTLAEPCEGSHSPTRHYAYVACVNQSIGCSGGTEERCGVCGWFYTQCPCGCENGESTISHRQERALRRKHLKRQSARGR